MKIKWTRQALDDLQHAFEYVFQDDPKAAVQFLDLIETSVGHLSRHPDMGRTGRVPDTRELIVPDTPYIIAYQAGGGFLHIAAIIHSSRRWPGKL